MRLLHLVIKKQENGRNTVFRSKQTPNKESLFFLDVKMLEEKFDWCF